MFQLSCYCTRRRRETGGDGHRLAESMNHAEIDRAARFIVRQCDFGA
jgi:hypothetical protein